MSRSTPASTGLFEQSPEPWKPHKLQLMGVKWLLEHAEGGVFADPGVGKTSMTFAAVKLLKRKGLFKKGLVVADKNPLTMTWPDELYKWTDFHDLKLEVLHGGKKDEALHRKADLYGVTPEGLHWLTGAEKVVNEDTGKSKVIVDVAAFKKLGFDTLIWDELTTAKNHQSDRHRTIKAVLHTFRRRWGLTGEPTANGLKDLFGEIFVLDMGKSLGRFVTHFRHEFMTRDPFDVFSWNMQEGAEERIYARISPIVLRIDDSHLNVPIEVPRERFVRLEPKAMKTYKAMEDDLITMVRNQVITAVNAATATGKCGQIASGGIYKDWKPGDLPEPKGPRKWLAIHDEKTQALEELLAELQGQPLLCAYWYRHDLERITRRLGRSYGVGGKLPMINGGTKTIELRDIQRRWNGGSIPLLLVQPASGGRGLNLQRAARHVCWYTMPNFNYELYDQMIRRVRRQGNKAKHVFVHHLIAKDTIDEIQYHVLTKHKRGVQQRLFAALKAMARRR